MKSFKQYFNESNEAGKGAFKRHPIDQQPARIPIELYDQIKNNIENKVQHLGDIFIPSIKKITHKDTTGDMDVIIHPNNRAVWREDILKIFGKDVVAKVNNGPQMMLVVKNLLNNGEQYMVDFILAQEGSFEYRKQYSKFGTIIPAVVGSFARSLRYKFEQNEFDLRLKDKRGNYHNIRLTNNFDDVLKILMLDPTPVKNDDLYTPQKVAKWITDSPRFDSNVWAKPPSVDGQTIITKNVKSHRTAKAKDNVKETYALIDNTKKKATWDNTNYKIERMVLGNEFVDSVINKANSYIKKSENAISGNEIMDILNIKAGPEIGKIMAYIKNNKLDRNSALSYVKSLSI